METTTIYLLRHGRTKANEEERFAGRTAEPLVEKGRIQARRAGELLATRPVRAVYSSPMARTVETSEIIAGVLHAPVILEPGLAEIRIPQWDGRLKRDLFEDRESGYRLWKQDPGSFRLPGAETLVDLQERAVTALKAMAERHPGGEVAAVTHLAVMRCVILHLNRKGFDHYGKIEVKNAIPLVLRCSSTHLYVDGWLQ